MNVCIIGDGLTSLSLAKNLINKKIENGELKNNATLNITAHIKIDELGLNHTINSTLLLP